MTKSRFRFTIRKLLALTGAIAGITALVVSFGPHVLWASRHVVFQRHLAFTKIDSTAIEPDCELAACSFNGLSFEVPTSMIGTAKVIRTSRTTIFLSFEDATRILQIPLAPIDIRTSMANVPSELKDLSSPQLLELSLSSASDDFSLMMSKNKLMIHDWAIETREYLCLDAQNMDHYSRISGKDIDAILISADVASLDSNTRIRSILAWETTDLQAFGSIWFGDSRNVEVGWIYAVARSLTLNSEERLTTTELLELSDAEILSRLVVSEPQEK